MNLADRITRRLLTEPALTYNAYTGHVPESARLAAMEAEDSFRPIARTMEVKPALVLAEPDVDALRAVGWEEK